MCGRNLGFIPGKNVPKAERVPLSSMALHVTPQCPPHLHLGCAKDAELSLRADVGYFLKGMRGYSLLHSLCGGHF